MLADYSVVDQLKRLRLHMGHYAERYPAAMEVRTNLGNEIWEQLELYRLEVVNLASLTRSIDRMRRAKEAIPDATEDAITETLDRYFPEMESYIYFSRGEDELESFLDSHYSLQADIVDQIIFHGIIEGTPGSEIDEIDIIDIIDVIQNCPMPHMRMMFRRQPIYWLVYNFYFPVVGRMTWPQLARWAILKLRRGMRRGMRRGIMEPPAWSGLWYMRDWDLDAIAIWLRAELEAIIDIERRFASLGPQAYV